jgi:folate-binding protein YgfZ
MNTAHPLAYDLPGSMPRNHSGPLQHLGVLRFTGPDAIEFLQGQLSNDTRRLASSTPLLAAYSSAQGRVLAVLRLLPHSSGILAILPRELVAPTLERLRKFILRAKVKIEDVSEQFQIAGHYGAQSLQQVVGLGIADPQQEYAERDGIAIARVSRGADRFWVVSDGGAGGAADDVANDWRLADIRAGLPQVYAATCEAFVAQMLNLDLIDGISFTKGCYTGQEIVARTQHLGRIKRRLLRLRLPEGQWSIGQALQLSDGRTARLAEIAAFARGYEALAVVTLGAAVSGVATTEIAGEGAREATGTAVAAVELPLPYSLEPQA